MILAKGTYSVTPSSGEVQFDPESIQVTLTDKPRPGVDFLACSEQTTGAVEAPQPKPGCPAVTLKGKITDFDRAPYEGVHVCIFSLKPGQLRKYWEAVAGPDGRWEQKLPPDTAYNVDLCDRPTYEGAVRPDALYTVPKGKDKAGLDFGIFPSPTGGNKTARSVLYSMRDMPNPSRGAKFRMTMRHRPPTPDNCPSVVVDEQLVGADRTVAFVFLRGPGQDPFCAGIYDFTVRRVHDDALVITGTVHFK
jgi:hypothetical protein